MADLWIDRRLIGADHPAYLVAEIGINHNGDMDLARRTIDAAKAAGADAVKFQTYQTEEFIPNHDLTWTQMSNGRITTISQFDMFKAAELSDPDLEGLARYCREIGIDWHATPMSVSGVAKLVKQGCPVLKNGSDCLGHLPLIKAMRETGLPTVISTGMATLADIEEAVTAFGVDSRDRLILLLCTSQYPAPPAEVNLRRMETLSAVFGCRTGFSDHTEGDEAAIAAVALGACWIEKHFTLDRALPGPDHRFSADPVEFAKLATSVRIVEQSMGTRSFAISQEEAKARSQHRLSCAAQRDLAAGHILGESDIGFMRPGTGWPPGQVNDLLGRRLTRAVPRGVLLAEADFR